MGKTTSLKTTTTSKSNLGKALLRSRFGKRTVGGESGERWVLSLSLLLLFAFLSKLCT